MVERFATQPLEHLPASFQLAVLNTLVALALVKTKFVSAVFVHFHRAVKTYSMVSVRPARFVVMKPWSQASAVAWEVVPWQIAAPIIQMVDASQVRFAATRIILLKAYAAL